MIFKGKKAKKKHKLAKKAHFGKKALFKACCQIFLLIKSVYVQF